MKLRDYQRTAVRAIWDAIAVRKVKATVCAMPTGAGKSLVIADLAGGIATRFPDQRILCVTHSKILVGQNAEKMRALYPGIPFGIVSAGLGLKEYGRQVTFAGIGSIYKKPTFLGKINILIVDECHAIGDDNKSMYSKLFTFLRALNPNLIIIGLSATPYRMGMGLLTDGDTFDDICLDMTTPEWIAWFVAEGYLVPLIAKRTQAYINMEGVKIVAGDYQKSGMSNAAMKADMSERAIAEALPLIMDRKSIGIYCTSVEHVEQVVLVLDSLGCDAEFVHSKRTGDENEQVLERFNNGTSRFIVSMGVLTTGWDCPRLDCEIILRPSRSPGLWVQILGRGTRPMWFLDAIQSADGVWAVPDLETTAGRLASIAASQKHDCLVLDFARNTEDIGPFDDPRIPKKKGSGGGEAIMKACSLGKMTDPDYIGCGTYAWPAVRICKDCGHEYRFEVKFDNSTSGAAIMSGTRKSKPVEIPEIAVFPVARVTYARHSKLGKPDSVKVSYTCGIKRFTTYLCPEHGGGAAARARQWWRRHVDDQPPREIDEWMTRMDEARIPNRIKVRLKADWPDILDWEFDNDAG
jgi:DNA repair protein RadD